MSPTTRSDNERSRLTMLREKPISTVSGWFMLPLLIAVILASFWGIVHLAQVDDPGKIWMPILAIVVAGICLAGLFVVNPNDGRAVLLFGHYLGSARTPGFHWVNPFTTRTRVSMRVRNFESAK